MQKNLCLATLRKELPGNGQHGNSETAESISAGTLNDDA